MKESQFGRETKKKVLHADEDKTGRIERLLL